MTDETNRMVEKIAKLEHDNVRLIDMVKQRDAKIYEMKDQVIKRLTQSASHCLTRSADILPKSTRTPKLGYHPKILLTAMLLLCVNDLPTNRS